MIASSESKDIHSQKHFSIVYHIISPFLASVITFFFLWALKSLLLLDFIFQDLTMTIIGFIVLTIIMIIVSWYLPQN